MVGLFALLALVPQIFAFLVTTPLHHIKGDTRAGLFF